MIEDIPDLIDPMADLPAIPDVPDVPAVPTAEGVVGWIVVQGVKYVVKRIINDIGKEILKRFIDEDGDGLPDNPDDEGEEYQLPTNYIVVNPDGTMVIYDSTGTVTAEECDMAYSLWLADNSVMTKKVDNYSVTEGLLALVLLFTVLNFFRGLFTRRDFFR